MEAATEHDCRCGVRPARVWVQVADDVQPMCRACAHRAASDPVFLAGLAEAYRGTFEDVLQPLRLSKPVASPPRERQSKAAVMAARFAADPELRQRFIEIGLRVAAIRRACGECSMVTSAGGLATHQRATGHEGWDAR